MYHKKIVYFLIYFSLFSCNFSNKKAKVLTKNKNTDKYYTDTGGIDFVRFPLSKPFVAMSLDNEKTWSVGEGFYSDNSLIADNVVEINFCDDIIFCHSIGETIVDYQSAKDAWYIITSKKYTIRKGFTKKKDFIEYAKTLNIDVNKLDWKSPSLLFKQFDRTGCLPWIPGCE